MQCIKGYHKWINGKSTVTARQALVNYHLGFRNGGMLFVNHDHQVQVIAFPIPCHRTKQHDRYRMNRADNSFNSFLNLILINHAVAVPVIDKLFTVTISKAKTLRR